MQDPSPEVSLHAFIVENLDISGKFNMKMKESNPETSHINTFSIVELSSKRLNFEEEIKALESVGNQ